MASISTLRLRHQCLGAGVGQHALWSWSCNYNAACLDLLLAAFYAFPVRPVMSISLELLREQVLLAQGQAAKKVPIDGLTLGPIIVAAGRSKVYKGSFNGMAVSVKVGEAQGAASVTVTSCSMSARLSQSGFSTPCAACGAVLCAVLVQAT